MSSNVFELVLELLAIDPIRRSAIGALLRTGGGREWQRRVGYQTFVKASGNTRLLRVARALPRGHRRITRLGFDPRTAKKGFRGIR